jgi:predicted MFS family arabinose efflux permease
LPAFFGDLRGPALWVVLGCLVCQLGLGLGYVFSPLLKPISEELGLSRAAFSVGNAWRLGAMSLASPLFGVWVARSGARPLLVASALLVLPTFAWLARMESLWELYAANALLGLVLTGFGDVTLGAVVATWIARGRGTALGVVYTGSNLAGAALVPLASWLAARGSWREVLWMVGAGATALILPFAWGVVRERAGALTPSAPGPAAAPAPADLTLREALRTRSFWILLFALFGFFFYMMGVLGHLHPALTDAGLSGERAGAWLGSAIGMGLVSKVAMGLLADRLSARPAMLLNYSLYALSSLLLLFVPATPWLQLFVVSFGFSYAARDVVYPLIIGECFGVRYLASIYGALMVVLWPAGSLGEIFAGFCFDRFGSYDLAFRSYAGLNALVFAGLFWLRDERRAV